MADEETKWSLNLDVNDALSGLNQFKDSLSEATSPDGLSGLISKFTDIGVALGAVSVAVLAMKEAFDLTLEAEQINAVNQQFDTLSANAGLFGDDLKAALEKTSGGLVDETTLLKGASQAMIGLGSNAAKLPEIMTVARQASAVFGGDLMTNFHNITQAIEGGNVKMLRNYGIIVDQQKAYKDYAASIGVSVGELSRAGQQQAILNATLATAKTSFAGVNTDVLQATNTWEEFKATMKDVADVFILVFDKTLGPAVRAAITGMRDFAKTFKDEVTAAFGTGREKIEGELKTVARNIDNVQAAMKKLEAAGFKPDSSEVKIYAQQLAALQAEYAKASEASKRLETEQDKAREKAIAGGQKVTADSKIDLEKRKADLLKFQAEVDKLRASNFAEEMRQSQSEEEVNRIHDQQVLLSKQQLAAEIKRINLLEGINEKQKAALIEQTTRQSNLKIAQMDDALMNQRKAALDNYAQHAETRIQGVTRAFQAGSDKNKQNLKDFSQMGKVAFDSFSQSAASAFENIGSGSESVSAALLGMFLGPLSTIAIQQGTFMLLSGIWPPNPVAIAGGGALIALGGALKAIAGAAAGGGAAPSTPAPSAGANTSVTGYGTAAETPAVSSMQSPTGLQQTPQKTVNVTIQGNYMETNESKTALMDMIRQSTDATDFNLYKVGGQ